MKRTTTLAAALGVAACGILGMAEIGNAGTIDAISAASFTFKGGTSAATSATVSATHTQGNGTWRFYYDVANHTALSGFTFFGGAKIGAPTTVTGLKPLTTYYFWAQAYDGTAPSGLVAKAKATGTFKTNESASIIAFRTDNPSNPKQGRTVDPIGRRAQDRGPIQINRFGTRIDLDHGHR